MVCLDFLYNICPKHFSCPEEFVKVLSKGTKAFMQITRYSCQILINLNFLDRFQKNPQMPNFILKNPLVAAELFHEDRQTDGRRGRQNETNRRFSEIVESA
jgi:hypothetical protein